MGKAVRAIKIGAVLGVSPGAVLAHPSEGGLVLLLPTDLYIGAGVASVAATVLLLAVLPARAAEALFRPLALFRPPRWPLRHVTSCLAALFLGFLLWAGMNGPRDPLTNPLPLAIWTLWWIVLVTLQGLIGNHWRWINPWSGPAALLGGLLGARPPLRYPRRLGHLPALAVFFGFYAILLADPAPADPARLAGYVGVYWLIGLAGTLLFGPAWLVRAEGVTVMMRAYLRVAVLGRARGGSPRACPAGRRWRAPGCRWGWRC
jgi:hypothetical protein